MSLAAGSGEGDSPEHVSRGGVTVSEPSAAPGEAGRGLTSDLIEVDEGRPDGEGSPDIVQEPVVPAPVSPTPSRRQRKPMPPSVAVLGACLTILAALLLGFAAEVSVVGSLEHNRAQRLAYATLRGELANGEGPVGPVDHNGALLAAGDPVALLKIPALDMTQVVLEGTTSRVLADGPGHLRSTPLPGQPGNSWIMGRRAAFGGPFAHLDKLRPRDLITVTTGQGISTFSVLDVRRAGDPQPPTLAAGAGRLMLLTASGPGYEPDGVLRVDAALTSPVLGKPIVHGAPALSSAELPLHGDPSVLAALVLWAQALLVAAALVVWARVRWGLWQSWAVGVPLLTLLGLVVADHAAQLLPNLM